MPQTQVCPPSLHISLGIFHRLFTLLEQECHDLDLLLAKREDVHLQPGTEFENYYTIRKQIRSLEQQVTSHHQQAIALDQVASLFALTLKQPEQKPQLQSVRQEAIRCRKRITELVKKHEYILVNVRENKPVHNTHVYLFSSGIPNQSSGQGGFQCGKRAICAGP